MATAYTTSLRLAEPTPGDPLVKNAWGTIENTNWTLIESAVTGTISINIAGLTAYTLTVGNGAADQSRPYIQVFTGALAADCTVTIPNVARYAIAINATTGGKNVILTTGSGTTASIPPTQFWYNYWCGGTNVSLISAGFAASNIGGALNVAGALGVTGATSLGGTLGVTGLTTLAGGVSMTTVAANAFAGIYGSPDSGGFNFRALSTNYGVGIRNDDTQTYLLTTNSGNRTGSFNTLRPFSFVNSTGVVTIDATGAGVTFGGSATITGSLGVVGSTAASGTGCYVIQAGVVTSPAAWSTGVSIHVAQAMSATGFLTFSDGRFKDDVEDITPADGVDWVMRGRPRKYLLDGRKATGFIAQEDVAAGRGDAVTMMKSDDPRAAEGDGVVAPGYRLVRDYEMDIAYLTAALQSALARLADLESGR
jgi:hypothetical protein